MIISFMSIRLNYYFNWMMPFDIFYKNNKKKKTNKNLYLELKKKKCYSLFHHMELNL